MSRQLFIIANNMVRQRAVDVLQQLPIGFRVLFQEPQRSRDQNDKMWAMLTDISHQCTLHNKSYNTEQWKCIFMKQLGHDTAFLPTIDGGSFFPIGFSSSKLSKREMADLITSIQAHGDQNGVEWKDVIHLGRTA